MAFKKYHKGKTKSRSGYEERIKCDLDSRGVIYGYETIKMRYTKLCCPHCHRIVTTVTYTPDFVFDPDLPSVVEAKGRFTSADRSKMLAVKRDNPTAVIRLIFQRNERIKAGVEFRNGDWADKHGFEWFAGERIPDHWLPSQDNHTSALRQKNRPEQICLPGLPEVDDIRRVKPVAKARKPAVKKVKP